MVKVGFIREGETERIIIESASFRDFLTSIGIAFINAINAAGNGNLLPKNIIPFTQILSDNGANKIIILTDLDKDKCITETKKRIDPDNNYITIISAKSIEAWFLADSKTLSSLLKRTISYEFPEEAVQPWETLKLLFIQQSDRGIGNNKIIVAKKMIKNGFTITNAAAHDNCTSAKYFVQKLKSLAI